MLAAGPTARVPLRCASLTKARACARRQTAREKGLEDIMADSRNALFKYATHTYTDMRHSFNLIPKFGFAKLVSFAATKILKVFFLAALTSLVSLALS